MAGSGSGACTGPSVYTPNGPATGNVRSQGGATVYGLIQEAFTGGSGSSKPNVRFDHTVIGSDGVNDSHTATHGVCTQGEGATLPWSVKQLSVTESGSPGNSLK